MAEPPDEVTSGAADLVRQYPAVWDAFSSLDEACARAGPLEEKSARLIKLALAIGIASEGAVHFHCRRALAEGITPQELKHVAVHAVPTLGFSQAVRALTWIEDITDTGRVRRQNT